MGAVSYGQAGYVGTSMSVRARAAYESGEMPMSKWTRGAIISVIKDYCDDFDLAYRSAPYIIPCFRSRSSRISQIFASLACCSLSSSCL